MLSSRAPIGPREAPPLRATALAAVLLALAPFALAPGAGAAGFTVSAVNFAWTPDPVRIDPGDAITFVNGEGFHSFVRDDGGGSCALPCTRTFPVAGRVAYHCGFHPSMRGTIHVGPGLDVTVSSPTAGQTVAGLVVVSGAASHPSDEVAGVTVRFDGGEPVAATLSGGPTSVTWSATLDSRGFPDGARTLVARATTAADAVERAVAVVVDNPDTIDLRVLRMSAPQSATTGSTVSVQVRNDGNAASGPATIRVEYRYQGAWHPVGDAVADVPPFATLTRSVPWDPPGVLVGRFDLRAVADPDEALVDVDRSNNALLGSGGWFTSAIEGVDVTDPTP